MWLLWLALACTPKAAPAATADAPEPPRAGPEEQAAFDRMAAVLAERASTEPEEGFDHGAALALSLVEGVAAPEVRAAAADLLEWLATADLSPPPPLPAPGGVEADERASLASAEVRIATARDRLRVGDFAGAVEVLRPLQGTAGWDAALPYWEEAADGYVAQERERAGERFMEARHLAGPERLAALEEVRATLAGLLEDFPDSPYAEPLRENLARVERAIESSSD